MKKIVLPSFTMFLLLTIFTGVFSFSQNRGIRIRIKNLAPDNQVGKQYLVLIAINKYKNWNPLFRPVKDAEEIRETLESRYFIDEVLTLYDEKATKEGIIKLFKELQGRLEVKDSVLIFYAGHGHLDKASKNGFWIPVDGGLDENIQERWIPNSITRGLISQMKSKHILLISDSCFSGDLLEAWREKTPAITHEYFKKAYKRRSRQVLTSGASERVPDNSEFSAQLKLALEENDKPYLDPLSIYNEIRWGIKGTLPMFGYLKGTNHQEGGAFLFFLEEDRDKPADVKAVESITGRKAYKNNNGYWEMDHRDGIIMVYIPEGWFTMGSNEGDDDEKPPRKIYLDGYWIGKNEVTVSQYMKFANETKNYYPEWLEKGSMYNVETGTDDHYKRFGSALKGDNYPIVGISWHNASAYCDWLSKRRGLKFKLPTEAQWEKAARGTNDRKYPWGNHELYHNGKWYANYLAHVSWEKRGEDGSLFTAPVGSYDRGASPFGLLDMAGNVWEWCSDWYDSDYYKNAPQNNPTGPEGGFDHVLRGGSWYDGARILRCANRYYYGPSNRNNNLGFRLCQDRIIGE